MSSKMPWTHVLTVTLNWYRPAGSSHIKPCFVFGQQVKLKRLEQKLRILFWNASPILHKFYLKYNNLQFVWQEVKLKRTKTNNTVLKRLTNFTQILLYTNSISNIIICDLCEKTIYLGLPCNISCTQHHQVP